MAQKADGDATVQHFSLGTAFAWNVGGDILVKLKQSASEMAVAAATAAEAKAPPKPATLPKSVAPTADSYGTPATLAEMERAWRASRWCP